MKQQNASQSDSNQVYSIYDILTPIRFRNFAAQIWACIMLIFLSMDVALKYFNPIYVKSIPAVMLTGLVGVLLPFVYNWGKRESRNIVYALQGIIKLSAKDLNRWLLDYTQKALSGGWKMWLSGSLILILGVATLLFTNTQFMLTGKLNNLDLVFILLKIPLFFFCGTGAYSTVIGILASFQLRKLPLRIPVYYDKYSQIRDINIVIFKYSFAGLIGYSILLFSMYLNNQGFSTVFIVWAILTGIISLLFFPSAIWGIHLMMLDAKKATIRLTTQKINQALKENARRFSKTKLEHIEALFKLRNELDKLPEWPINIITSFTLLAQIIPSIVVIINFINSIRNPAAATH